MNPAILRPVPPVDGCTRRQFLAATGALASLALMPRGFSTETVSAAAPPRYLRAFADTYAADPRGTALRWFREAKLGLFLHYGLYSLEERGEWLQLREKIPVAEYARLKERFTASRFDADAITDLALAAGMQYVNLTSRHHDGFCLFQTRQTDFNSVQSTARRDLVGELADACARKGLGLCLYYSHGRDWRHPDAPNNDQWGARARPNYDPPESSYHQGPAHDLQRYLDFVSAQIGELLTQYGPIAAIWLDGIAVVRSGDPSRFHCQELYDRIHRLQPQVLVSYKQGLLGTEDFFAPEDKAIANPSGKPMEICTSLQQGTWGYHRAKPNLTREELAAKVANAGRMHANLLLNTGPAADGSILPAHELLLREVPRMGLNS